MIRNAIFAAAVAGLTLPALAAEKPTSSTQCLMVLVEMGGEIESGRIKPEVVEKLKPKAQDMPAKCQAKDFDAAFEIYKKIQATTAEPQKATTEREGRHSKHRRIFSR